MFFSKKIIIITITQIKKYLSNQIRKSSFATLRVLRAADDVLWRQYCRHMVLRHNSYSCLESCSRSKGIAWTTIALISDRRNKVLTTDVRPIPLSGKRIDWLKERMSSYILTKIQNKNQRWSFSCTKTLRRCFFAKGLMNCCCCLTARRLFFPPARRIIYICNQPKQERSVHTSRMVFVSYSGYSFAVHVNPAALIASTIFVSEIHLLETTMRNINNKKSANNYLLLSIAFDKATGRCESFAVEQLHAPVTL